MDKFPAQSCANNMPETPYIKQDINESSTNTTQMAMMNQQSYEKLFQLPQELMNTSFMPNPENSIIPPTDENKNIFQPLSFESKYRPGTSVFQTYSSEFRTAQRPSAFLTHPNLRPILPYVDSTQLDFSNSGPSSANSINKENINDNYSSRSIIALPKQESKDVTDEQRAAIKKERNRTAARRSREKRQRFVMSLEHENRQLWIQNSSLITELNELKNLLLEKRMEK